MHVDRRCHSIRNRLTALSDNIKLLVVDIEGFSFSSNDESDGAKCFSLNDVFREIDECTDYNYKIGTHKYLIQTVFFIITEGCVIMI